MGELPSVARTAFIALTAFQVAVLATRLPSSEARGELSRFALFLVFLGLRLIVSPASPLFVGLSVCLIWAAGEHLAALLDHPLRRAWALANAVFLGVLLFATFLDFGRTVPYTAFNAVSSGILLCFPITLMAGVARRTRRVSHVLLLAAVVLCFAAGAVEAVSSLMGSPITDLGSWTAAFISLCTGYLVFQDGYLLKSSSRAFLSREKLMKDAYARLLASENALVLQDRLIVSGLLAMGAAHEFKNVLAHIKATAESGLQRDDADHKDRCLRLLADHADAGGRAAADFLVRFSREGREEAKAMDAAELIGGFAKTARAGLRSAGILMRSEAPSGLRVIARKGEIEQVLLNLAGNAAECFRRSASHGRKTIDIICHGTAEAAVIEVRDNAGGVTPAVAEKLFQISPTDSGNTGLGLYLSRSLAERNSGSLTYVPLEGGSCFRLILPCPPAPTSDTRSP
jgi:signal transduction histidine kinase